MVNKPKKLENHVTSYRLISLLTTVSKIFEKIFMSRLSPVLDKLNIIPKHVFYVLDWSARTMSPHCDFYQKYLGNERISFWWLFEYSASIRQSLTYWFAL